MQEHSFEYPFKGSIYVFSLPANSREEAEERLTAIKNWGKYSGMVGFKLPGWLPVWAVVVFCHYLNWRDGR